MTMTTGPGLAGLQARTQAELAPRLMAQLQRLNWGADQLADHQTDRLRALLARAIEGSPFHARRLGHNRTQPLIRYELTDSFTAHPGTEPVGYLRATVGGRDDGMLRYGRTGIHAEAIGDVLASSAPVTEHQVRQTERGIDVDVVAARGLDQAALTAALAGVLRRAGLPDPEVTLRVVAAIARRPDTGKTRRFIPSRDDAGAGSGEGPTPR